MTDTDFPPVPPDPAPALSPEEWEAWLTPDTTGNWPQRQCERLEYCVEDRYANGETSLGVDGHFDPPERHALAALCLYQQPFGFSQEDVRRLEKPHTDDCSMWWLSDYPGAQTCNCGGEQHLRALASRIQQLLPPTTP